MREVMDTPQRRPLGNTSLNFEPVETKDEYVANVNALKNHIQRGDIYEVNYCTAFKANFEEVDSVGLYKNMVAGTEALLGLYQDEGPRTSLYPLNDTSKGKAIEFVLNPLRAQIDIRIRTTRRLKRHSWKVTRSARKT